MKEYGASSYGDAWADRYDEWTAAHWDVPGEVDFLAELARGGRALELGVGTGRVAIPLAERGVEVVGIDASEAMLAKLHEKSDHVATIVGDMADVAVEGEFDLVYVVFNTFFGLLTQDEHVRCFRNVAARLKADGAFVLQLFVPDLARFDRGQRVSAKDVELGYVALEISKHDPVAQTVSSQNLFVGEDGVHLDPVRIRYAWPSELDLMARLAGLRLRDRFADFLRAPFGPASGYHVSVYEKETA